MSYYIVEFRANIIEKTKLTYLHSNSNSDPNPFQPDMLAGPMFLALIFGF